MKLPAALAEALLQSHAGEISLFPALPAGWSDGAVSALRARGGFEVSMQWKSGKLEWADLRSRGGTDYQVRPGQKTRCISLKLSKALRLNGDLADAGAVAPR